MFLQKKTVDQIVGQFNTMVDDLDKVINDEVYNEQNLLDEKSRLESELKASTDTRIRANNIKQNILSLVK